VATPDGQVFRIAKGELGETSLELAINSGCDVVLKESTPDFKGKLKGKDVELPNVKTKEISYTKRAPLDCKQLRKEFDSTIKSDFLQDFATKHTNELTEMGFSKIDILKLQDGRVPTGYQVHHKLPLDDGGTNDFNNLVLIKNDPYHKTITNYQNSLTKGLYPGKSINVDWPIPNGDFYNGK